MKLITRLSLIRNHGPCVNGWRKLLAALGPDFPEDADIHFDTILKSNGLDDALWALCAVIPEHEKERDKLARLYACDCVESVLHIYESVYPKDDRPREAVRIARAFAQGKATVKELDAARHAVSDAADYNDWPRYWVTEASAWAAASGHGSQTLVAYSAGRFSAHAVEDSARTAQAEMFLRYFCRE